MFKEKYVNRFWERVKKTDNCWIWNASTDSSGYGHMKFCGEFKKSHRISWEIHNGPIPPKILVCHKCDNPPCVRPDHLFLGTNKDNKEDCVKKNRHYKGGLPPHVPGEKHGASILTEKQVLEIRKKYTGKYGNSIALAKEFGVDRTNIRRIVKRLTWKHI